MRSAWQSTPSTRIALLAGTRGRGPYLSVDGGETWRAIELPERDVYSVAISAADGALYTGTEPSRLFRSRDGEHWEALAALQDNPSRAPPVFAPVALAAEVLDLAARVSATQAVRAYNAVQLGSALAARAVDPSCVQFACFDEELRDAAARCGFGLITG